MSVGIYTPVDDIATSIVTLNNEFYQRITNFAQNLASEGKFLTFNFKALPINHAGREFVDNGTVVDLGLINPFYQTQGVQTLADELAYVRATLGGFDMGLLQQEWYNYKTSLAVDYLLSTSLCYVEVFNPKGNYGVDKFMATRSPLIACIMNGDMEYTKMDEYRDYLYMSTSAYQVEQFYLLKLTPNKASNTFRVTKPSKSFNLSQNVKITPICLMKGFMEGIQPLLESNILKFSFIKDNLTIRDIVSTTSTLILNKYYEHTHVVKTLLNRSMQLSRGYMRIPELGISKHDETGVRALNLSRIVKIEILQDFDATFIDVDFDRISPAFKEGISTINDMTVLQSIYYEVVGRQPMQGLDFFTLRNIVLSHADTQFSVGTTTAKREFHKYMVERPHIFKTYNGGKQEEQPQQDFNFNMGLEESQTGNQQPQFNFNMGMPTNPTQNQSQATKNYNLGLDD